MEDIAQKAREIGDDEHLQRAGEIHALARRAARAAQHRGAQHREDHDGEPVQEKAQGQRQRGPQRGTAEHGRQAGVLLLLWAGAMLLRQAHGLCLAPGAAQIGHAPRGQELGRFHQPSAQHGDHQGREHGEHEGQRPAAALAEPALAQRIQQGHQHGREHGAHGPAALHQRVDEAAPPQRGRVGIDQGEQLAQVGGVDALLCIAQARQRAHHDQQHEAQARRQADHPAGQRRQARAQRGARHGDDDALAPPQPVGNGADGKGHDHRAQRHPGVQPRLLLGAPLEVLAQLRQQGAEEDEVVDGKDPGEKADPGGVADLPARHGGRGPGGIGPGRGRMAGAWGVGGNGGGIHGVLAEVGCGINAAGGAGSRRRSGRTS